MTGLRRTRVFSFDRARSMNRGVTKMTNAIPVMSTTSALLLAILLSLSPCSVTSGTSAKLDVHGGDLSSSFRTINRRKLQNCLDINPYKKITLDTSEPLADFQSVTVNVSGILLPSDDDWIAVVSPSNVSVSDCAEVELLYLLTGDTSQLPLICHYPVKFQFLKNDPGYLSCANSECRVPGLSGSCLVKTCSSSITFELINIRTDILFVLLTDGLEAPCVLGQAGPVSFANPNSPLYGHLSSVDSSGTSISRTNQKSPAMQAIPIPDDQMRLTWVSGDPQPQTIEYASGSTTISTVSTFAPSDLCDPGAASDFGWHHPGYIHTAVMTGLSPSTQYTYKYGSETVGFSSDKTFTTPPAAGTSAVTFIIYGDMGKAERDGSLIHFIQPGSLSVIDAVTRAVDGWTVDFVFHIGDISYATGFLVEWENFLNIIEPVASRVSYMTAIGNHERDHPDSGSYYGGTDSGGECGIPYYNYFQMPTPAQDKPWYSIESGPVHFTFISTEHDWRNGTEQYVWIQGDLASVNRSRTPWVIYSGHRPMYSSLEETILNEILPSVDPSYTSAIEPLLLEGQVDLALAGHVHNYERLCAVYGGECLQNATKDGSGMDTFNFTTYSAPVQAVIGMSGFTLDAFRTDPDGWSTVRISEFGYVEIQATGQRLQFTFFYVNGSVGDSFAIVK